MSGFRIAVISSARPEITTQSAAATSGGSVDLARHPHLGDVDGTRSLPSGTASVTAKSGASARAISTERIAVPAMSGPVLSGQMTRTRVTRPPLGRRAPCPDACVCQRAEAPAAASAPRAGVTVDRVGLVGGARRCRTRARSGARAASAELERVGAARRVAARAGARSRASRVGEPCRPRFPASRPREPSSRRDEACERRDRAASP